MKRAAGALGILVLCLVAFLWFREVKLFSVGMDGFMYPGDEIKVSLIDGGEKAIDYEAVEVKDSDDVFGQFRSYYVDNGKERKKVSISLPIVSEDGARVMVFEGEDAVTDKYVQNSTFPGAVIADGVMYNIMDGEQVDKEKYVFLKSVDKIFLNLFEMVIKVRGETRIPVNSLVYFERNELRYYYFDKDSKKYRFSEKTGIDLADEVLVDGEAMSYGELLKKLGVIKDDRNKDDWEEEEYAGEVEQSTQMTDEAGGGRRNPEREEKLDVSASFLGVDTYAAKFSFYIYDPKSEIVRFPTVEIYKGDKVYARKTFYSTSEGREIVGLAPETYYTYEIYFTARNKDEKLIKTVLDKGEFWTKNMDGIEPVSFSFADVVSGVNDVTFHDMKLQNSASDRVLRGLNKIVLEVAGQEVKLSSGMVASLKDLKVVNYTLPSILDSNTFYHMELKAYDVVGNSLNVLNGEVDIKTTKAIPTARVIVKETDLTWFRTEVEITNPDSVNLENLRYVILDGSKIVKEGSLTGSELYENNLMDNKIYQVLVYADYDLNDGYGNRLDQLMADVYVATVPVSTLGNLRMTMTNNSVTKDTADFDMEINERTTDAKLVRLLKSVTIIVEDPNGDEAKRFEFAGDDLFTLTSGNKTNLLMEGLNSNTDYTMRGEAKICQGDVEFDVGVVLSVREFKTMKKPAEVEIIDRFVSSSIIDFAVRISDPDGSITSDRVIMKIERVNGGILGVEDLGINEYYKTFSYKKLDANATFELMFTAEGYNEGFTDLTAEPGKVLLKERITTTEGVTGTIALESLLRQMTGKNHYDILNTWRWKDVSVSGNDNSTTTDRGYDLENEITYLSVKNGWRIYSYFLPELVGKTVTVSFDAKIEEAGSDTFSAVVANDDANVSNCWLSGISDRYKHYSCTFKLNERGYVGLRLQEVSNQNRLTRVAIRRLQIEEGGTETTYEKYQSKMTYLAMARVSLSDSNREITNNDYYIKVYKQGELVQEIRRELDDSGEVVEQMTGFDVELSNDYTVRLAVRIDGADHDISSTEFTTEEEIRSVRTLDEFKKMHIAGKYFIIEDLDFRGQATIFQNFYGGLDFQGHKFYWDLSSPSQWLIRRFYGTMTNVDFRMYLDTVSTNVVRWRWMFEHNYGVLRDFMITIEESIPDSTYYSFTTTAQYNQGVIENFVIHLKVPMFGIYRFSPLVEENWGIIRNGYAYGDEGVALVPHYDPAYVSDPERVGVFAALQGNRGRLENVFSLVNVDGNVKPDGTLSKVGNLIGLGYAENSTISHVYSNADGKNRRLDRDINWLHEGSVSNYAIDKMYYVLSDERIAMGEDFAQNGSIRISSWTLRDVDFQNDVLNTYGAFDVDGLVKYGYYPHVKLSEVMPNQEYIPLPAPDDKEYPDVVSVMDVVQESNSSAVVTFKVRNYYGRDIIDMTVDKLSTEILEQTHKDRYTTLKVRVSNPAQFLSSYSVLSISNGKTTGYAINERKLDIEMYREIYNTEDWRKINEHVDENYRLMNDLNFAGVVASAFRINRTFNGKLDGNGYTIRNIRIDSGGAMFGSFTGVLMNLNVENYVMISSGNERAGLVGTANVGSKFENVHMKDIVLYGGQQIGGLVGIASGTIIRDTSIKNISLAQPTAISRQTELGGLVGKMMYSTLIENVFVENLDFDIREAPAVYTAGGLVGNMATGTIDNAFATGRIQSRAPNNGGIVGRSEGNGLLRHAYAIVDIFSSSDVNIGGIVGELDYPERYIVSNTLSLGAVYSSLYGGGVRRVLGGDTIVSLPNFAWSGQHINGVINDETNGEVLMSTSELNLVDNYVRIMEMGEGFCYDEIGDNSLPMLYKSDGVTLMPNQEKNYLKDYEFEVKYMEVDQGVDGQGVDNAWIYLEINNPSELDITNVKIDDVKVKQVTQNKNVNGVTFYRMEVEPIYYYDSYRLSEITYSEGSEEKSVEKDTKVKMQFFRDIWTVDDWQKINPMSSENYRLRADLDFTGVDINRNLYINRLDGFENGYTLSNISIEGRGNNTGLFTVINGSLYNITFRNVNISNPNSANYAGIVLYWYGRAEKLKFDNVNILTPKTNNVGVSADNLCSDVRDIVIENSTITGASAVGGFAGKMRYYSVTGVEINDTIVSGTYDNVGGFVGDQWGAPMILQYNITARHVKVSGRSVVGGIYGRGVGGNLLVTSNSKGEWSEIVATKNGDGASYAGGVIGFLRLNSGSASNIHANGVIVKGVGTNIGGVVGYSDRNLTYSTAKRVTIDGGGTAGQVGGVAGRISTNYKGDYLIAGSELKDEEIIIRNVNHWVGGICGGTCTVSNSVVNNLTIDANAYSIGGVVGRSQNVNESFVRNSKVYTFGDNAGGIVGGVATGYDLAGNAVVNTEVKGRDNVGGLVGQAAELNGEQGEYRRSTVNATRVEATRNNAGGLIGYMNSNEYVNGTTIYNVRKVFRNIVENTEVIANQNAGGLVGHLDISTTTLNGLQHERVFRNVVAAASVRTTNAAKDPGVFFGNNDELAYSGGELRMTDMRVYDGMMMQKGTGVAVAVKDYEGNNFNLHNDKRSKLLTLEQLKTSNAYSVAVDNNFVYPQGGGYFPYLRNINNLAAVETSWLLVEVLGGTRAGTNAAGNGRSLMMATRGGTYHRLPEYTIYPAGANVLNVEFSSVDDESRFILNGVEYPIDKRVFSFYYNFEREVDFALTDGTNTKLEKLAPEDLRSKLAVVGNDYYVLKEDGEVVSSKGDFGRKGLNVFGGKMLVESGVVVDLATGEEKGAGGESMTLIEDAVPLFEFERSGSKIDVFAKYSVVDGNEVEKQILVKGAQMELVDANIKNKKTQVVIDSYNNKDYLTILGDDGVIYDLKTAQAYPENFRREEVVEISSNVGDFTRLMAVRYGDGKVIVFDYQNGDVVYVLQPDELITPLEYFWGQMAAKTEHIYNDDDLSVGLENATGMVEEIGKGTVVSVNNAVSAKGEYITSYDPVKNEYEIFEVGELLKQDPLGATSVSVSDRIYGDNALKMTYGGMMEHGRNDNVAAMFIYGGIAITIVVSLTMLGDLLRKKYSHFEESNVK